MDGFCVCGSICMRKSGSFGDDQKFGGRMGKIRHPFQCYCAGTVPNKRCLGPVIARQSAGKFDMRKVPLRRVGEHQELANLAAYLVSDYSAYMNGEVVTIDGGEWLQGAGEFNMLEDIPQEMWDMLEAMIKAKRDQSQKLCAN